MFVYVGVCLKEKKSLTLKNHLIHPRSDLQMCVCVCVCVCVYIHTHPHKSQHLLQTEDVGVVVP
jgi:hypothetical protein